MGPGRFKARHLQRNSLGAAGQRGISWPVVEQHDRCARGCALEGIVESETITARGVRRPIGYARQHQDATATFKDHVSIGEKAVV